MIIWLTAAAGLGILAAAIAYAKGRPPLLWGVGGTFLGIVVVPYLLLTKDRRDERGWRPERFGLPSRGSSCPHCGARADAEAVVCRVCRKSLINYSPAEAPSSGDRPSSEDRKTDHDERAAPREARAAAASAKPAARTTEEASRDPMFRRLDDAFARITVEMRRPAAEQGGEGAASDPTGTDGKVAAARRQAEAEHPVEAGRQAEAKRQAAERQAEAERQAAERHAAARRQAEAGRLAEAERQAEVERQIAERQAEAERQASARRQAEAERQAEVERQAAERQAEAERQAAARRQAEAERQAEARRQAEAEWRAEAERAEETQPHASEEMRLERHPAQQREDERDDEREEPRFDRLGPREEGADDEDEADDGVSIDPRMGKGDPRLTGAWREGRPGFPSMGRHGRERKPWGRRASLALVGMLAVVIVLLAPYTGDWMSRLSPPSAPPLGEIADAPAPAGDPTNEWETASGGPDTDEPADADPSPPASGRTTGPDGEDGPVVDRPSRADQPADGTERQSGEEKAVALTPPPPKVPPQPTASARPAPAAPEKRAVATASAPRAGRSVERTAAPRREAVEAPLPEDFATAVRKALSEHRSRGSVLGALEVTGITAAGEIVSLVQQRLRERGYDPGSVDGRAGPRTRTAIEKFQRDQGRTVDGEISVTLLQHLGILGQQIHAFGGETAPTMTP